MSSVAEQLRRAREAQRLTVQQVAELTKIKTDQIRALEEGDYDCFAAPVYIRGSVRSYAGVLKMPITGLMPQLETELAQTTKFRQMPGHAESPRGPVDWLMFQLSRLDWRKALIVMGVILLMATGFWMYRYWQASQSKDPLAGLEPGLYRPPANTAAEVVPLPKPSGRK